MWRTLACRIGTWCALASLSAAAHAQPIAAGDGRSMTMSEALERTLSSNPALAAFGYQIEAQEGRISQSELRPNPELGVQVENFLGSGERSGVDVTETTLSLGWVLERGKREQRVEVARAGLSMLESEAEFRRLNAAADTALLLLESLAAQERLRQRREAVDLAEGVLSAVGIRVDAGRSPLAELSRARADLARARLQAEDVQHELRTAYRRLAAQWGSPQPSFDRVEGDLHRLPEAEDYPSLLARIDENPELQSYLAQHRLREAELQRARAEARPDWRVSAGVRRFELGDDFAMVAGLTLPLTTRNRNQGRIAEAEARLALSGADEAARRLQLETELFALYQELRHSRHRAETLRAEILPNVERAVAETERAYELGRYGYLELRQVQSDLLGAGADLLEAEIQAHQNAIEIERLTGTTIRSRENQP